MKLDEFIEKYKGKKFTYEETQELLFQLPDNDFDIGFINVGMYRLKLLKDQGKIVNMKDIMDELEKKIFVLHPGNVATYKKHVGTSASTEDS